MSHLSVGSTVAGCRLEAVAGRGGMGVVYRATQLALDRPVAVKVIAPQLADDEAFRERFEHEAHLAASIDHPNVIPVYEAGERDGALYLIMRWVEGTDLRRLLRDEGALAPDRAVRLLRPVASALAAAHRRGLVHRDVKPANVLVTRGEGIEEHVYLTDFGIARRVEGDAGLTRTGVLVGTLDYTAPERIEGGRGDAASDIYAFGCVLFETLTGAVPFDRGTELQKMHAHVNDAPPSARAAVPAVPLALDAIAARAMAKDPAARFATAADLASALDHALDEIEPDEVTTARRTARAEADTAETETPAATRAQPPAAPARARSRRPLALVLGGLLAAVVAVVVLATRGGGGPAHHAAAAAAPTASGDVRVDRAAAFTVPGARLGGAVLARGELWVAVPARGQIVGLRAGRAPERVDLGGTPGALAADARGRIWASGTGPRQLTVFDPGTGSRRRVATGRHPGAIAMGSSAAWVADGGEGAITRIPLATLRPARLTVPSRPAAVLAAFRRVWVATSDGSVSVFDEDGRPDAVASPSLPAAAVAGAASHGVWFVGSSPGERSGLTRINPRKDVARETAGSLRYAAPTPPTPLPGAPADLAGTSDSLWLAAGDTVRRVNTEGTGRETGRARFPSPPGRLMVAGRVVWVTLPATGRVYRLTF